MKYYKIMKVFANLKIQLKNLFFKIVLKLNFSLL